MEKYKASKKLEEAETKSDRLMEERERGREDSHVESDAQLRCCQSSLP